MPDCKKHGRYYGTCASCMNESRIKQKEEYEERLRGRIAELEQENERLRKDMEEDYAANHFIKRGMERAAEIKGPIRMCQSDSNYDNGFRDGVHWHMKAIRAELEK